MEKGSRPPAAARGSIRGTRGTDNLEQLSHEELLELCLFRREEAWQEFLRRFSRLIYSVVLRYDLPEEETEEAYQATIVAVFRQLPRLQSPEKLVSWIVGISARQAINRIRAYRRETTVDSFTDELLRDTRSPLPPQRLPDEDILLLERAQQVREGLEALPERCRRLLFSLFFEDPQPEYREIAGREQIAIGNIGPLRARCLEKLRAFFGKRGWLD